MRADKRARVMAKLEERVLIGLSLRNDRNIAYPVSLDYHITRLLDSLRHYVIKVRLTFAADHFWVPAAGEVHEGYLRRYAGNDVKEWKFVSPPDDMLALHRNVNDRESVRTIGFIDGTSMNDYERLLKIECIDQLLLGDHDPVIFWVAPDAVKVANAAKRRQSLDLARRHAKFFLVHAAVVLAIIVALFVPVVQAYAAGNGWKLAGWCIATFVLSMLAAATLIVWEDGPPVSVLWRTDLSGDASQSSSVLQPPSH